jgi:hypothetical protein
MLKVLVNDTPRDNSLRIETRPLLSKEVVFMM